MSEESHDESRVKVGTARTALGLGLLLLLVASPFLWIISPEIFGLREINAGIREIKRFDPGDTIIEPKSYGGNTYTDDVSSRVIKKAYTRAARALTNKGGELKTYLWDDFMGWPRISTVLQEGAGHIEVRASRNNDSDSVYISFSPGRFDQPEATILPDYHLPDWLLRDD